MSVLTSNTFNYNSDTVPDLGLGYDDVVDTLTTDLNDIDTDMVLDLLNKYGYEGASRKLGSEISNYDYPRLAGRLLAYDMKSTSPQTVRDYVEAFKSILHPDVYKFMLNNEKVLDDAISKNGINDYNYDYFSFHSLMDKYLLTTKYKCRPLETIQFMWMRVSVFHYYNAKSNALDDILRLYGQLSNGKCIKASPTLFNAGTKRSQCFSCFLIWVDDNIDSICRNTVGDIAKISQNSGGIGITISNTRHSEIDGVGMSAGIIPWLGIYDKVFGGVNQRGKRNGAGNISLAAWHIDIMEFSEITEKTGDAKIRTPNLNNTIVFPFEFWKRVRNDEYWTLFCPAKVKQLDGLVGHEFSEAYALCEADKSITPRKTIKANDILAHITSLQRKGGMPYVIHGDSMTFKCNQKNIGRIMTNLCLEITEATPKYGFKYKLDDDDNIIVDTKSNLYKLEQSLINVQKSVAKYGLKARISNDNIEVAKHFDTEVDTSEIAACNLASLSLKAFAKGPIVDSNIVESYDFDDLGYVTQCNVKDLDTLIDNNWYPLDKIKKSNMSHRPMGIGVSGLAEAFYILDIEYESDEATYINKLIFACMYFNALVKSIDLAIERGVYDTYGKFIDHAGIKHDGSPISKGKLQFDLWRDEFMYLTKHGFMEGNSNRCYEDDTPLNPSEWNQKEYTLSNGDVIPPTWDGIKDAIAKYGIRNSLLISLMPTASSSRILQNAEITELHHGNIYSRKFTNSNYSIVNPFMISELKDLNMWNTSTVDLITSDSGSVQLLPEFYKNNAHLYPEFVLTTESWKKLVHVVYKYKTQFEISQKKYMKMTADRARYICQSQSTNIHIKDPTPRIVKAMHMYTNNLGLKTGMYYLRQHSGSNAIKFTVDPKIDSWVETIRNAPKGSNKIKRANVICTEDVCISCQ